MRRCGVAIPPVAGRLVVGLMVVGLGLAAPLSPAGAASVGVGSAATHVTPVRADEPVTTDEPITTEVDLSCAKPGVVRPNCGVKPQQAGDRGGALQYTIWGLLILALAVVFGVIFRSAARTNRQKTTEVAGRDWS